MFDWYVKKIQQLGKTFVRYDGVTPTIVTIDPEIIKEVTAKQFDNFTDILEMNFSPEQTTLDVARYFHLTCQKWYISTCLTMQG